VFSRPAVAAVTIPLKLLPGIATYFNSRASIARQSPEAAANPQTALMNKLALYVFPLGVVVGGPFLPIAIIIYWVANNIWTFGQQHLVFGKIEKEEEAKKEDALARRSANAPAPGVKPAKSRRNLSLENAADESAEVPATGAESGAAEGGGTGPSSNGAAAPDRTPRPGARPKKRKR
jgi:YidC/Oxa1 family membrane protein insertase